MIFTFENKEYKYPVSLTDISLGQRIDFHNVYGLKFDEKTKKNSEIENQTERAIEEAELKLLFACQSFSFFTNIALDIILEKFDLNQVMNVYNASLLLLLSEQIESEERSLFEFNNEKWTIASPALKPNSKITFNEFITSKEIVRQLEQFGNGRWQSLLYLCCIYFRKEGEEFTEDLVDDEGDRMKLLKQLPLDIALYVGFFLTNSMYLFLNSLESLSNPQLAKE